MKEIFFGKLSRRSTVILALVVIALFSCLQNSKADTNASDKKLEISLELLSSGFYSFDSYYVGNLGGLKVRIPKKYISIIEYDGEPSWPDPEKNKYKQEPTENSGIRGMSMRIKVVETSDGRTFQKSDQYKKQSEDGRIITLGMNSNSHFGSGNGLEAMTQKIGDDPRVIYQKDTLESSGLTRFRVVQRRDEGMTDLAKKNMLRRQKDYFVKRNHYGRVETWIECSVNAPVNNMCTHYYYPDAKRPIGVYLTYRAKYFQNWEQIQNYSTQTIYGFKVD